jgi:O-antigen ligase
MASMVFGIAFTNELLIQDKLNWKRCAVLAVAVISTLSTTGCTVLIIAVGLRYIFTKSKTKGAISLKLLLLPTTVVVALVALNFLLEQKLGTGSGSTRVDDFVAGYKAWLDAPLFGNGYGNTASYVRYMSSFRRNNIGFSNSLMQVLAYGGIYLFLPYCVSLISGFVQLIKGRMWRRMSFYITFIYAFIITVCPFQMLTFYLFISMARGVKKTEITQQQTERLSD